MRTLRLMLVGTVSLALFSGLPALAQEASPEPSPSVSPEPLEAEAATEPLPVADYWVEWGLHKKWSRERLRQATYNAKYARSKKTRFYRALLGVHDDELQWLANHQHEDCYAGEYERWRSAVEDLQTIGRKAVTFARKGNASGLERLAKQRRGATKELDRLLSNAADCVAWEPPAVSGDPFVGSWTAHPVLVQRGGFVDRSVRRLTISDDGRMLMRIPRNAYCRQAGYGLVPMTIHGKGEMVMAASPEFHFMVAEVYCHPRGGRILVGRPSGPGSVWEYDAATDTMPLGGECYWRTKGGSPKDCEHYWRGTPPKPDDTEASEGVGAALEDAATARPDEPEG